MERIALTKDLSFSRLVYGMWRLDEDTDTSPEHIRNKIAACLDQGITTIDQADIYGGYMAEELLGTALTPALRNKVEIVTKCGIIAPVGRYGDARVKHYDTTEDHINKSIDYSLKLMGIEHIDLLLIHRPDPMMDHIATGAALDAAIDAGKVRAVGVSNFRPWDWTLLQSGMRNNLVTNQIELSLAQLAPFTNGDLAFHQQNKHPVMAWSPLGGGSLLSNDSGLSQKADEIAAQLSSDRASVLLAFLLAHPAMILPVIGTNTISRITSLAQSASLKLDRQSWFELYTAALGQEVP